MENATCPSVDSFPLGAKFYLDLPRIANMSANGANDFGELEMKLQAIANDLMTSHGTEMVIVYKRPRSVNCSIFFSPGGGAREAAQHLSENWETKSHLFKPLSSSSTALQKDDDGIVNFLKPLGHEEISVLLKLCCGLGTMQNGKMTKKTRNPFRLKHGWNASWLGSKNDDLVPAWFSEAMDVTATAPLTPPPKKPLKSWRKKHLAVRLYWCRV